MNETSPFSLLQHYFYQTYPCEKNKNIFLCIHINKEVHVRYLKNIQDSLICSAFICPPQTQWIKSRSYIIARLRFRHTHYHTPKQLNELAKRAIITRLCFSHQFEKANTENSPGSIVLMFRAFIYFIKINSKKHVTIKNFANEK